MKSNSSSIVSSPWGSMTSFKVRSGSIVSHPWGSRNTLHLELVPQNRSKSIASLKSRKSSKSVDTLLPFLITEAHAARVNRPVIKKRKKASKKISDWFKK